MRVGWVWTADGEAPPPPTGQTPRASRLRYQYAVHTATRLLLLFSKFV
jgi:hypothetical protein